MEHYEKANKLKDADFKQLIGVTQETFEAMIKTLTESYAEKHQRRGRHFKLSIRKREVFYKT